LNLKDESTKKNLNFFFFETIGLMTETKNSFHILPVLIPGSDKERVLYFKEQKPAGASAEPSDASTECRTLYVGNLHAGCTEDYLEQLFGICGPIESVQLRFLSPSLISDANPLLESTRQRRRATNYHWKPMVLLLLHSNHTKGTSPISIGLSKV